MNHGRSLQDETFRADFEAGRVPPDEFNHSAHLRLAYIFLTGQENDPVAAHASMRRALAAFLERNGVDPAKYHETLTQAWILAVRHFLARTERSDSAAEFLAQHPQLQDAKIMLTHYSADRLFSPAARAEFVEPDLDPIPRHQ